MVPNTAVRPIVDAVKPADNELHKARPTTVMGPDSPPTVPQSIPPPQMTVAILVTFVYAGKLVPLFVSAIRAYPVQAASTRPVPVPSVGIAVRRATYQVAGVPEPRSRFKFAPA